MDIKRKRFAQFSAIVILGYATAGQNQMAVADNRSATTRDAQRASDSAASLETSKWKVYRNKAYGFDVKYPEAWNVHGSSGTGAVMLSIDGPFRGAERPSLHITIQPNQNPDNLSIDEWFAQQVRKSGVKPESTGQVTIGGQAAVFMENTNSFGRHHDVFTLLNKVDVLSLAYVAKPEYDSIYESIVSSFYVSK